jgi:hypothetical protein
MHIKNFILPVAVLSFFLAGFNMYEIKPDNDVPDLRKVEIHLITQGTVCTGASVFVYESANYSNNDFFQQIGSSCVFEGWLNIRDEEEMQFTVDICLSTGSSNEKGHTSILVKKSDKAHGYTVYTAYGTCEPY